MITNNEIDDMLSRPWNETVDFIKNLDGDIAVLGIGGKMGPTLGRMIKRAAEVGEVTKRVVGVSRFSDKTLKKRLESWGIECFPADLLNKEEVKKIPLCKNVIFMAGRKFGESGTECKTWAFNTLLPANVCEHFNSSRIVAFSTGCVYPLWDKHSNGPSEEASTDPLGEYSNSCVGRERIFEYFSMIHQSSCLKLRLNYSVEPRYGIIWELAANIKKGKPISLLMPFVNVIWQGDANNAAILSLTHTTNPPNILNVTGPKLYVKTLAEKIAARMGLTVNFIHEESYTALLSNNSKMMKLLTPNLKNLDEIIDLTVKWVQENGSSNNKNLTHFQVADGKFLD
jgi:hypothetical protein